MAHVVIQPVGSGVGRLPLNISGALGQTMTVTTQEIASELNSRGYTKAVPAPISPPVSPPITIHTMPAMTRPEAISKGVTAALKLYGYASRCTRLGGCALSQSRFDSVVARGVSYATSYLQMTVTTTRTASVSPVPGVPWTVLSGGPLSTRLSGVGRSLYGMGQSNGFAPGFPVVQPPVLPGVEPGQAEPGMTTWDWVAIISNATRGVASTLEAYANARAQRERAGQTATLTADQVKVIVNEALVQNPALNRAQLIAAAAGAGGRDEPKGMPGWVIPAVVGIGVVAFMSSSRGRRF